MLNLGLILHINGVLSLMVGMYWSKVEFEALIMEITLIFGCVTGFQGSPCQGWSLIQSQILHRQFLSWWSWPQQHGMRNWSDPFFRVWRGGHSVDPSLYTQFGGFWGLAFRPKRIFFSVRSAYWMLVTTKLNCENFLDKRASCNGFTSLWKISVPSNLFFFPMESCKTIIANRGCPTPP